MYRGMGRDPVAMGYPSDMSNQNASSSDTSTSVDLVSSARHLEQHFKEKYKSLRSAYTQRVRQLADVVTDTCASLFTDEMLEEMKGDKLSITFIPSHINEIIERHLESERELFIHQTVDRCSTLEVDLAKATNLIRSQQIILSKNEDEIVKLKRFEVANIDLIADIKARESKIQDYELEAKNLRNKLFELEDLNQNSDQIIEQIRSDLSQQEGLNTRLQQAIEEARVKILQYEESIERKAHDLEELEQAEYNERSLREDLKDELTARTKQNDTQQAEINDLCIDIRFLKEALERKDADLQSKLQDERRTRDKVDSLMEQVEGMLVHEAKISNATIEAMHEKMKILRHRLAQEITREKRISAALQDELNVIKAVKDEKVRDLKVYVEEESRLRALLLTEQQSNAALTKELQQHAATITEGKMLLIAAESSSKILNEKLLDLERMMGKEISYAEERARLEAGKDYAEERRKLEEAHSVYRLQVQSQFDLNVSRSFLGGHSPGVGLGNTHSADSLRHSYPTGGAESPLREPHRGMGGIYGTNDLRHSYTYGQPPQHQPFLPANASMLGTQGPQFFNNMNMDGANSGYMKVINDLKDQLADSYDNIDELKRIVKECRRTNDEQQRVIDEERAKLLSAQQQQQHMHRITEQLVAATAPVVTSGSVETTRMLEQSQSRVLDLERQLTQLTNSTAVALANSSSSYSSVTEGMEKLAEMKRQQIMYLEDINKKNNVINALNDRLGEITTSNNSLESQVQELQDALAECQDQAMKDQASDMLLISEMQRKFESLMSSYENSSSNDARNTATISALESQLRLREEELSRTTSSTSSDNNNDVVVVSNERIAAFESQLLEKEAELAAANRSVREKEAELAAANRSVRESSNVLHKLSEDMLGDAESLRLTREENRDLHSKIKWLKGVIFTVVGSDHGSEEASDFYEWDIGRIEKAVETRVATAVSSSLHRSSSSRTVASSSVDSSTNTAAGTPQSAATQTASAGTSTAGTNTALGTDSATQASTDTIASMQPAAASVHSSPVKSPSKVRSPSAGRVGSPSADKVGSPSAVRVGSPSAVRVGSPSAGKVGSPSAGNIYADLHDSTERIYGLEVELANSARQVRELSEWRAKGEMCIISYDSVLKGFLGALAASSLMSRERGDSFYRKYIPAHAQQVATFEDTNISAAVRAYVEESLRAGGRVSEELSVVRNEHKLLLELSRMESEAAIKALNESMADLRRDHEVELSALRGELANIESSSRRALDVELAGCRADELARTATMASKLKAEQSRRQHLQSSLEEMEKNYNQMASQLSDALLRAEAAENELLKNRFKL